MESSRVLTSDTGSFDGFYVGAAPGAVGLLADATYTKTLKRPITVRRGGNFNARLMFSYYVRN
ncbi:MAG: hypothetical protein LBC04_04575 [Holosporaceae bacterium]|nr:hypothetical protein [Holosporaceae bacterium]